MKKVSIKHLGNSYGDWLRALVFYKQELDILKERLTEIVSKNTNADLLKQVEHFENQLKVQNNNIDNLHHDIELMVTSAAIEIRQSTSAYVDESLIKRYSELQMQFECEERLISQLRHEFNEFAIEWM